MQLGPPMRSADFLLLHNLEIIILVFLGVRKLVFMIMITAVQNSCNPAQGSLD
jgi:hypothetical protein